MIIVVAAVSLPLSTVGLWALLALEGVFQNQPETILVEIHGVDELPSSQEIIAFSITDSFGGCAGVGVCSIGSSLPVTSLPGRWHAGDAMQVSRTVRNLVTCQTTDHEALVSLPSYGHPEKMYLHFLGAGQVQIVLESDPDSTRQFNDNVALAKKLEPGPAALVTSGMNCRPSINP